MNLARISQIREAVQSARPDVIVNAAAYTKVDHAEIEPDLAMMVNGYAPGILAEEAKKSGSLLVHFSTDFVFNGGKNGAYSENDPPDPINVYGSTKLAGERLIQKTDGLHLIFRTSWVYGLRGSNFVSKLLNWAREHDTLRIVQDQFGSPTWTNWLAQVTAQVIRCNQHLGLEWMQHNKGLYHLASRGIASRYEWGKKILDLYDLDEKEIHPALTKDFPSRAIRPCNSALNSNNFSEVFNTYIPDWREMLEAAIIGKTHGLSQNLESNSIFEQTHPRLGSVAAIPKKTGELTLEMAKTMLPLSG